MKLCDDPYILRLHVCMWGFPNIRGTFLGGPYNKDCSIWGSMLGHPHLGKLPCSFFGNEGSFWVKNYSILGSILKIPIYENDHVSIHIHTAS